MTRHVCERQRKRQVVVEAGRPHNHSSSTRAFKRLLRHRAIIFGGRGF